MLCNCTSNIQLRNPCSRGAWARLKSNGLSLDDVFNCKNSEKINSWRKLNSKSFLVVGNVGAPKEKCDNEPRDEGIVERIFKSPPENECQWDQQYRITPNRY